MEVFKCFRFYFQDSQIIVERFQSGLQPPGDIPFEDLSTNGNIDNNVHNHTPRGSLKNDTVKGTISGGKSKARKGIFGIFGHSKVKDANKHSDVC